MNGERRRLATTSTNVYREVMRSVWPENEARQRVSAPAYVVDRGHVQYAGRLSLDEQLRYVQQGHGRSGNNRDYVLSTVKSIEAQGFRDPQLHQLALMLHGDTQHLHPPLEGTDRQKAT
jgi:glutathione-specific gamma-glutamylcyclotransferase